MEGGTWVVEQVGGWEGMVVKQVEKEMEWWKSRWEEGIGWLKSRWKKGRGL